MERRNLSYKNNILKPVGNFLVKAGKVVGGALLTLGGAAFALATLPFAVLVPGGGYFTQIGFSTMMYGAFTVGSVFDSKMQSDMDDIKWNPFHKDENLVLGLDKVSFYKGMPVVRIDKNSRSGSFLGIFLVKGDSANDLRHERGHGTHQNMIGPLRFGITVAISSPLSLGPWYDPKTGDGNYYAAPWEAIADMFGGVQSRSHSTEEKVRAGLYTATSLIFPPATYLFLIWK